MAQSLQNNRGTYYGYFTETEWNFVTRSEIDNPPSLNHSSPLTLSDERLMRQGYSILLWVTGHQCSIGMRTIRKAIIYLHRFYTLQRFQDYNARLLASVSLFTACKYDNGRITIDELYNKMVENELIFPISVPNIHPCADVEKADEYIFVLHTTLKTGFYMTDPAHVFFNVCMFLNLPSLVRFSTSLITLALLSTPLSIVYAPEVTTIICIMSVIRTEIAAPQEIEDALWFKRIDRSLTEEILNPLVDELYEAWGQVCPILLYFMQSSNPRDILELTG